MAPENRPLVQAHASFARQREGGSHHQRPDQSYNGVAWKQIEHLTGSAVDESNGSEQVLAALDKAFKYDDSGDATFTGKVLFYHLTRRSDQTFLAYCSEQCEHLRLGRGSHVLLVRPGLQAI